MLRVMAHFPYAKYFWLLPASQYILYVNEVEAGANEYTNVLKRKCI